MDRDIEKYNIEFWIFERSKGRLNKEAEFTSHFIYKNAIII